MKTLQYTLSGGKNLLYPVKGQISGPNSMQLRGEVYDLARSLAATRVSYLLTKNPILL